MHSNILIIRIFYIKAIFVIFLTPNPTKLKRKTISSCPIKQFFVCHGDWWFLRVELSHSGPQTKLGKTWTLWQKKQQQIPCSKKCYSWIMLTNSRNFEKGKTQFCLVYKKINVAVIRFLLFWQLFNWSIWRQKMVNFNMLISPPPHPPNYQSMQNFRQMK